MGDMLAMYADQVGQDLERVFHAMVSVSVKSVGASTWTACEGCFCSMPYRGMLPGSRQN